MQSDAKPDYKRALIEAEAVAAAVKDPELRKAAFEKLLDRLLARTDEEPRTARGKEAQARVSGEKTRLKSKRGPSVYIGELVDEGFFKQQRALADVRVELAARGHHVPSTSLSGPMQKLCQNRRLRREKSRIDSGQTTYCYSEW